MLRYQRFLALGAVFIFATDLSLYLYITKRFPVPPLLWVAAFVLACVPLLARPGALRATFASPLAAWCAGFFALSGVWFAMGPPSDLGFPTMRQRLLAIMFLLAANLCFSDPRIHRTVRLSLIWVVGFACVMNVYDLTHPFVFSKILGRGAGLYLNPNTSAAAILFLTLLAYDAVSARFKSAFLVVGIAGVLLTVSRGALATCAVVLALLFVRGAVQVRNVLAAAALLVVVGTAGLAMTGTLSLTGIAVEVGSQRLGGTTSGDEFSTATRREVATRARDKFLESPAIGAGLGSTAQTTHNMYLMYLAEHGALGVIIFPALIIALTLRARGTMRTTALACGVFLSCWAFFSHNLMEELPLLVGMALLAAICSAPVTGESTGVVTRPLALQGIE